MLWTYHPWNSKDSSQKTFSKVTFNLSEFASLWLTCYFLFMKSSLSKPVTNSDFINMWNTCIKFKIQTHLHNIYHEENNYFVKPCKPDIIKLTGYSIISILHVYKHEHFTKAFRPFQNSQENGLYLQFNFKNMFWS